MHWAYRAPVANFIRRFRGRDGGVRHARIVARIAAVRIHRTPHKAGITQHRGQVADFDTVAWPRPGKLKRSVEVPGPSKPTTRIVDGGIASARTVVPWTVRLQLPRDGQYLFLANGPAVVGVLVPPRRCASTGLISRFRCKSPVCVPKILGLFCAWCKISRFLSTTTNYWRCFYES